MKQETPLYNKQINFSGNCQRRTPSYGALHASITMRCIAWRLVVTYMSPQRIANAPPYNLLYV